jgi:hypothetical protein
MMNMDKVICIGYFVAWYKKNNDVFLHWQHKEKCPEVIKTYNNGVFNLRQHFEISYSRYANKHYSTGVYITINDSYR